MAEIIIRVYNNKVIAKPGAVDSTWWDLDVDNNDVQSIKLDISSIDSSDIGTVYGAASQKFSLPNTATNNDFFNYAFNINSEEAGFTFQKTFPCQVLVDGASVATGRLFFDSVTTDNFGNHRYNCSFNDSVASLKDLLGNMTLADLDWSTHTHNFTVANVTGSWDNLLVNGDIIYPTVLYGYPKDVSHYTWDTSYFIQAALGNISNIIPLSAYKPSIRVKAVIDKIFNSLNYEYSSTFISNNTSSFGEDVYGKVTASFEDLYMLTTPDANAGPFITTPWADAAHYSPGPYTGSFAASTATFQSITIPVRDIMTGSGNYEVYDPDNYLDFASSATFTVPYNGTYRVLPQFTFTPNRTNNYKITFRATSGTPSVVLYDGVISSGSSYTSNQYVQYDNITPAASIAYELKIERRPVSPALNLGNTSASLFLTENFFAIDNLAKNEGPVNMALQFGNLKAIDFLRGLQEQFNLVFWSDRDNPTKIYIEPWNTFKDLGTTLDWSDKVDYNVKWEISHPSADAEKTLAFQNANDEDAANKYYIVTDNKPFGSFTYEAQSDYAKQTTKKIGGSFFAPTIVKPIPGTQAITAISNITVPHIYGSDTPNRPPLIKFKPRLLFKNGKKTFATTYNLESVNLNTYYQMSPVTTLQNSASKFDLNYSSMNYYWGADSIIQYDHYTDNDCFNRFWADYINNIYRNPARRLTCNIVFDPTDLQRFKINDTILIDGQTYLIDKIRGFNLTKPDSVEVQLIKLLYPSDKYRPIYIVDGNDDIQVPGHPAPDNTHNGSEFTFDVDLADPTKVIIRDLDGGTVPPDVVSKDLVRNSGYLVSGSKVLAKQKWDKQFVTRNVPNSLQYGINDGSTPSGNSFNVGDNNTLNGFGRNIVVVGDSNELSVENQNLIIVGNTNNVDRTNQNLVYIGDNSNSGVKNFQGSLIIDNTSGSSDLNSDGVTKSGLIALNSNIQLAGTMNDTVILANTLRGSTGVSIGRTGYDTKNCLFIGNDNVNATPSSEMDNITMIGNTGVNFSGYAAAGIYPDFGRITIIGNQGVIVSGGYWNLAQHNDYGTTHTSIGSTSYSITSLGNESTDIKYSLYANNSYINNTDCDFSGSQSNASTLIANSYAGTKKDISDSALIGNKRLTVNNNADGTLFAANDAVSVGKTDFSNILTNGNPSFVVPGGNPDSPGYAYPNFYATASYSTLLNNWNSYISRSDYSVIAQNQALDSRTTNTRTVILNTFSASFRPTGGSTGNTDSNYIGVKNTTLSGSTTTAYDRLTLLNIEACTFTGSHIDSIYANNTNADFREAGSNNIIMGVNYGDYNIGDNKIILGWPGILRNFDYQDFNLSSTDYSTILGSPDKNNYGNGPIMETISVITGHQYHYGAQYHGFDKVVGSAGGSSTLDSSANTIMLDWFSTAGTHTLTLPDAVDVDGRVVVFKANGNISATKIIQLTIDGVQRIDANTTYNIDAAYETVTIMAMDGQWWIIN